MSGPREEMSAMTRVAVTGLGVVSPLGNTVADFWDGLVAGRSGVTRLQGESGEGLAQIGGAVHNFHPESVLGKAPRRMDRFCQFAVVAAHQAIEDAGLRLGGERPERIGVYIGSGIGGIHTLLENHQALLARGPRRVSPTMVPMMIPNMAAAQVSIHFGLKGPCLAPVTACATGNNAIGEAFRLLQRGQADVVLAGGTEAAMTDLTYAAFANAKVLSPHTDQPARASRPFDATRDGFVVAEGAGVVALETWEHAQRRGASIRAEIIGYGTSADAYHMVATDPEGAGAAAAMRAALHDARVSADAVQYISAHATATPMGDLSETRGIKLAFGSHAGHLAISANKSMIGHAFGAAGGIAAVALVKTLEAGTVPPTINLDHPDPACDLDYVPRLARQVPVQIGLSNAFGFGGHNAVLVLKRV